MLCPNCNSRHQERTANKHGVGKCQPQKVYGEDEIRPKALVSIKSPRLWRGSAHLAFVNKECRDHDGWLCTILDNSLGFTQVCAQKALGDIVVLVDKELLKEVIAVG